MENLIHRTFLSLQTECISCIVKHRDKYSIEHLSLLPTRIRRRLLTCLPPLDIFKLEGTSMVCDLDMNEVWHVIAQHYDEANSMLPHNFDHSYKGLAGANFYKTIKDDWRSLFCTRTLFVALSTFNALSALKRYVSSLPKVDVFFTIFCRLIALPHRSELALHYNSFPDDNQTSNFVAVKSHTKNLDGLTLLVPNRHAVYVADSSEHTILELFTVMLKESNFRPKVMTISCGFLDYSEFYQCLLCEESNKSQSLTYSLFADMISEVECLEFYWPDMSAMYKEEGDYEEASFHTITSVLGAIFKNPSPKLSSLCVRLLNVCKTYRLALHDCLSSIAPFFSALHYTEASKNGVLPISTAYAGLKTVNIFAVNMDCPQDIAPIFHHQSGLEGIEVHFTSCPNPDLLLATIQDVVSQCQLQFCVFDCEGWWNNKHSFESTFHQFLKSSHDAEVHVSVNNDAVIIPACSSLESVPERKRFMINFFLCDAPCSGSIFSWLCNAGVSRPLKLVKSNDTMIINSHKDAFNHCLSTSQALEWRERGVGDSTLSSCFSKNKYPTLQAVTLRGRMFLLKVLPAILANSPQLKELSLPETFSGREKVFECLVSCPYPEQLTVDLRDNESLTQEDIEKLLQVWRKMGQGRKLKAILLGCDLQPLVAEMVLQN